MIEWVWVIIPAISIYSIAVYSKFNKIANRNKILQEMLKEGSEREDRLRGENNQLQKELSGAIDERDRSREDFDDLRSKFGEERDQLRKELSGAINENKTLKKELGDLRLKVGEVDNAVKTVQKELSEAINERNRLKGENKRLQKELSRAVDERDRSQRELDGSYSKLQKELIDLYVKVDNAVKTVHKELSEAINENRTLRKALNEKEKIKGKEKYEYDKISVETK